ncbi:MAG TPA: YceI family protein [Thermoanaerobaculia bacterium]|nr:YceI family protein [Thermoanaerobaculia bacterium]
MKTRTTIAAAALWAAAVVLTAGEPARFTPAGADVTIKGTSTIHEWQMRGATISGAIETDPESWKGDGQKSAWVRVAIPVASIRSEHERMDRLMREALKATANPQIQYEMTSASLVGSAGDAFVVRAGGKLTIAGTTRDVTMDIKVVRDGERYVLTAETPIRMSDFGIKAPVAMMGTIKTADQVTVSFRWTVSRS